MRGWQAFGAAGLLLEAVRRSDTGFAVDVRLIGVRGAARGRVLNHFAETDNGGTFANGRACAHYVADDFHKKVTQ